MKKIIRILFIIIIAFVLFACSSNKSYSIHTELQDKYLSSTYDQIGSFADGTKELSAPLPITLKLNKYYGDGTLVQISETEDFKDYLELKANSKTIEIYNLKIHTLYFYKTLSYDKSKTSKVNSFEVKDTKIRNIYVDGVTNVRDVGGAKTNNNTYVKQGMLYRSAKFNEDESDVKLITEQGIKTLVNDLKIKTEIDLRTTNDNESGGITTSPLGESVKYIALPFESSGNILTLNKAQIVKLFEVLSDSNNYPIVFHCSIGTDRTGLVSFIINALMGVSDDDLYTDYLFSNFGLIGSLRPISGLQKYYTAIEPKDGSNTKEKMYNYLISIGVTSDNISKVIEIMTE